VPDLEDQLIALGREVEWPATPDLVIHLPTLLWGPRALGARGWSERRRGGFFATTTGRRLALAAAALLIALSALAVYTPTREAIADWVNVHVLFQRVNVLPTPTPRPSGPLGERLGLGTPTTLAEAQSHLAWQITVPTSLGQPDEVYLQLPPVGAAQGEVTLVYSTRPGIPVANQTGVAVLITEARGSVNKDLFAKMLGGGTTIDPVTVAGHQGYWVSGSPHVFIFLDANGNFRDETMRLATNTLILDDGGTVVRIEGNLTRAQAVEIASSLR
jgi:hypothetical protein